MWILLTFADSQKRHYIMYMYIIDIIHYWMVKIQQCSTTWFNHEDLQDNHDKTQQMPLVRKRKRSQMITFICRPLQPSASSLLQWGMFGELNRVMRTKTMRTSRGLRWTVMSKVYRLRSIKDSQHQHVNTVTIRSSEMVFDSFYTSVNQLSSAPYGATPR